MLIYYLETIWFGNKKRINKQVYRKWDERVGFFRLGCLKVWFSSSELGCKLKGGVCVPLFVTFSFICKNMEKTVPTKRKYCINLRYFRRRNFSGFYSGFYLQKTAFTLRKWDKLAKIIGRLVNFVFWNSFFGKHEAFSIFLCKTCKKSP